MDDRQNRRANDHDRRAGRVVVLLLACALGGVAVWVLLFTWLF